MQSKLKLLCIQYYTDYSINMICADDDDDDMIRWIWIVDIKICSSIAQTRGWMSFSVSAKVTHVSFLYVGVDRNL